MTCRTYGRTGRCPKDTRFPFGCFIPVYSHDVCQVTSNHPALSTQALQIGVAGPPTYCIHSVTHEFSYHTIVGSKKTTTRNGAVHNMNMKMMACQGSHGSSYVPFRFPVCMRSHDLSPQRYFLNRQWHLNYWWVHNKYIIRHPPPKHSIASCSTCLCISH